jgi:uncharacterized NAD-dependent epimerase/dehydratase family protein
LSVPSPTSFTKDEERVAVGLNFAPFPLAGRRVVLLAPGDFSTFGAKTAVCYLRYRGEDVVAVVDQTQSGRTTKEILGFGEDIPVVADMEEALAFVPEVAVVGVAPRGGRLTDTLRLLILRCAEAQIDVVSGLHDLLVDEPAIMRASRQSGARLWDVRAVPGDQVVATGQGCRTGAKSVLVMGSDCNVGKMTATVELYRAAKNRGVDAAWAATGQTGMMLRERGIAVDRVIADFIGGAAEELVNVEGKNHDLLFVEGQGSLVHPGYAGVTLGLMFGVMPDCAVMVHAPSREMIGDSAFAMPPLSRLIDVYEAAMEPLKESPVVALALNTAGYATEAARDIIEHARQETGLPAGDPVRFGAGVILEAVLAVCG